MSNETPTADADQNDMKNVPAMDLKPGMLFLWDTVLNTVISAEDAGPTLSDTPATLVRYRAPGETQLRSQKFVSHHPRQVHVHSPVEAPTKPTNPCKMDMSNYNREQQILRMNIRNFLFAATPAELGKELAMAMAMDRNAPAIFKARVIAELLGEIDS